MRLFKYAAVVALVSAGRKMEANPAERQCLEECKDRISCHGQDNTDGPTECIQTCRLECVEQRKVAIKSHVSGLAKTQQKHTLRKVIAKKERTEQREEAKAVNPPPMIKDFHQAYENGDVPRRFVACLKNQRDNLTCEGHGQDMWGCKRLMVSNCLDNSDDFESLGSGKLVKLVAEFRENMLKAEEAEEAAAEVDFSKYQADDSGKSFDSEEDDDSEEEDDNTIMGVKPNKKDKVKVNNLSRAMEERKKGKVNYLMDYTPTKETPVYEDEEEGPVYDDEPAEDAEMENESPKPPRLNDPGLFRQVDPNATKEDKEAAEAPENKKKYERAMSNPVALYSYVGNGGSRQVMGGKNNKAKLREDKIDAKVVGVKTLSKDQFIDEMCRCRTSMEHYRVKNYLARHHSKSVEFKDLVNWEHHDETCKWCAFPNSKKCWQCQVHWKKAAESSKNNKELRVRNEQIEMSCFLYVRSVKNGKFNPMNSKGNDPCPMRNLHHGEYNEWQSEGKFGEHFGKYKELHHLQHQKRHPTKD